MRDSINTNANTNTVAGATVAGATVTGATVTEACTSGLGVCKGAHGYSWRQKSDS